VATRTRAPSQRAATPPQDAALDARALHALAAAEKDRHARQRIRAVAYFAEGYSSLDVAVRVNSHMDTVLGWRRSYLARGLSALRVPRTGARCRLTPRQCDDLRALIRANPGLKGARLCALVKQHFNVTYTEPGMYRLVTQTLKLRIY
jgi:transposase